MVLVNCEEIAVDDGRTLKSWLFGKKEISITRVPSVEFDRNVHLRLKDETGEEVSIGPASLSNLGLKQLGCKTKEEAVDVFDRCCSTVSPDIQGLVFDFDDVRYEIELEIGHFPKEIAVAAGNTDISFGSAKEALDKVDEDDATDSVYSHIPIKVGKRCTKYLDLREVSDDFCRELEFLCETDLESYFRSLTTWMNCERVLPFRRTGDATLLLPVPPATNVVTFKEFRFTDGDLRGGDAVRPSTQFGDWKLDEDGCDFCMAYRGQPFVYDRSRRRTRRLVLWDDLKREALERMLQECNFPVHKSASFALSFKTCFRFTRCMVSYEEEKRLWTMMVPEAIDANMK